VRDFEASYLSKAHKPQLSATKSRMTNLETPMETPIRIAEQTTTEKPKLVQTEVKEPVL